MLFIVAIVAIAGKLLTKQLFFINHLDVSVLAQCISQVGNHDLVGFFFLFSDIVVENII